MSLLLRRDLRESSSPSRGKIEMGGVGVRVFPCIMADPGFRPPPE